MSNKRWARNGAFLDKPNPEETMDIRIKFKKRFYEMKPGLKVRIDNRSIFGAVQDKLWVDATVVDVLSTQFTAVFETPDGKSTSGPFRFYSDVGNTWEPIDE